MTNQLQILSIAIRKKLKGCSPCLPKVSILRNFLEIAYLASLRTEESRFIHGSMTYADPKNPQPYPPICLRADFPAFTAFEEKIILTVESLVKLSRAINKWSGAIAIFATARGSLFAWGVVDQILHQNISLNREHIGGGAIPGILTVMIEGPGNLTVFHGRLFIASLRQDRVITYEHNALFSPIIQTKLIAHFHPIARHISSVTNSELSIDDITRQLLNRWADTVARLCIGLRRMGTGGSLLFGLSPNKKHFELSYKLPYHRLQDSMILYELESIHYQRLRRQMINVKGYIHSSRVIKRDLAEADLNDREAELAGAVKFVTALATIDGALFFTPRLDIKAFGVKIKLNTKIGKVYDAASVTHKGRNSCLIDISRFGTRHSSVLRFCRQYPNTIGVIVSQDGHVRLATMSGSRLFFWDDIRLLQYNSNVKRYLQNELKGRRYRKKHLHEATLGYGPMPKTFDALMKL